jgi:hypothetical protein
VDSRGKRLRRGAENPCKSHIFHFSATLARMKKNIDGATAVQALPTIIQYLGMTRGESMQEHCPHCDARGTVIHSFECDDGSRRGAMSGCIQLFPMSYLCKKHMALTEKADDYAKRDWKLNKSEAAMLDMILNYYAGDVSEEEAESFVRTKSQALAQWRQQKYRRR